jgi:serine/threonine protein kinase
MGTVWLCLDELLGRSVAVKEVGSMPGESKSDLARALREARNSAALNHRNVVSIYDAVEDGDKNWLVMEYVPSRNLSEIVAEEGPLPPGRVVWIGAQAADGLAAAHDRGTIHRDVKPGNILVTEDDHVKISDFGIARTHGDTRLTQSGVVTGTPAYFAPELAKGEEPTVAADVWALGATLYAAVEGRLPYPDQSNAIALLAQIAAGPPPPPERAEFLAEPIGRMMDPDPSTRWMMADVAHTLHRLHDRHGVRRAGPGTVSLAAHPDAETADQPAPESAGEDSPTKTDDASTESAEPDEGPATEATSPPEPAPARTEPAVADPDLPRGSGERRGAGRLVAVGAVVLLIVALAGIGAWLMGDRDPDPSASDEPTNSATDDPGQTGDEDAPATDDPATSGGTDGAAEPTTFVEDYYSHLPQDTRTAWDLLSPSMQNDVGGYGAYSGFWRTISDVRVERTTLVREGVVDVEVTYTSDRGTETETRRLRLAKNGDSFLISGDRVI